MQRFPHVYFIFLCEEGPEIGLFELKCNQQILK